MSTESTRPLLLPQNRKLRHLRGIALRNLAFSRPHGRTIDDAALNIQSPAKLESLRNPPQLHHALSSDDLRPPTGGRRSTQLPNASPATRQKKFEDAFESKLADAFFSLHVEGKPDPIYISEVEERSTNFNFRLFELADLDSSITQSPQLTVKVWAKRNDTWTALREDEIDLRALNWLGSLQDVHFPPNSLVFHLVDGVYSLDLSGKPAPPKHTAPAPTSSYNALMRLATLDHSVQDALATRELLTQQINDLLDGETKNEVPEAEDALALTNKYLAQQRRAVALATKRNEDLKASIAARKEAIAQGRVAQAKAAKDVENATDKLAQSQTLLTKTKSDIRGQRRRICDDLSRIYNITPVPLGPPLSFQICGLPLPNSTAYNSSTTTSTTTNNTPTPAPPTEDALSAALGHVAHLTDALQYYLSVPLPYPIRPFGSRSSIRDDISQLPDPQREFPLYVPRGGSAAQFRFDYGWFLLNKDVEALCASQGLRVVDIRHTLPNLKYLLYVCSAGSEEVPERKRGGVRGLWAGRIRGGGVVGDDASSLGGGGSRRGSDASEVAGRQREELRRAAVGGGGRELGTGTGHRAGLGNGNGNAANVNGGAGLLPFAEGEMKLSLRTKGLRESAAQ
ncbi:UV radiation resistance protein and autophagy-related subunit 14-domain-containing protein [Chaetomium tenue]|uniref:UV radiation resistance protein and autophagy-related subunit 14-domain-containing protein n=1 Tax=Chaetomium tenue TaxID=1854479 RepID=A0ACB7PQ40_9PEZI|nr:UV radiation resistance protein and autophagy-related subunit 14-domain-containing protein [Chaetomium globosum]